MLGDPAGGQGRRRGKKRKAALGAVVGRCCCRWFYEIMPLPPEGDRGTPGVASPGPAGRQLPVASIPVKP